MLEQVLAFYKHQFDLQAPQLEALGNAGGFSGAQLWRVRDASRVYCLRVWPEGTQLNRLLWIHSILARAYEHGQECQFVPVPLQASNGSTVVQLGSNLWQLEPWMPGAANYFDCPSVLKLKSAVQSLAQFHLAVIPQDQSFDVCPAIIERRKRLDRLIATGFDRIDRACDQRVPIRFREIATRICAHFKSLSATIQRELDSVSAATVPISPCIRDVWHDHLFFEEETISGLVDFGAMRMDSRATDISRLIGSLCRNDRSKRQMAIDFYQEVYPLSDSELALVPVLDSSTNLLSPINWLQWMFVDGRRFDHEDVILTRLESFEHRLQQYPDSHR